MADYQFTNLLVSAADGVGTLALNRPHRHNAVDDATYDELSTALPKLSADPDIRVIVIRGEGPSFCSGRDTAELGKRTAGESNYSFILRHQQVRLDQLASPKPILAELKGHVLGGGLELALAADIRIASTDTSMAFPEIKYGLITDTGGLPFTTALTGPSRAKFMLMDGSAR